MLCLIVAGGLAAAAVRAQGNHLPVNQYAHEFWQVRDGLPQDSIFAVAETPEGYLWLGTEVGLVRFDGVVFTVFDRLNTPALANHRINALAVDVDGDLWIATNGAGLVRYAAGRFERWDHTAGLPENRVLVLEAGRDGSLWAGTYGGGLARWRDGRFEVWTPADGLVDASIRALHEDSAGRLWIGALAGGLSVLQDGRIRSYTAADGLHSDLAQAFAESPDGHIWIGTSEGLLRFDGERFQSVESGLGSISILTLTTDADGCLWIGSAGGGVSRLNEGESSTFTRRDGLTADSVRALFVDSQDNLWIGTAGGGVNRLREGAIRTLGRPEGLASDLVLAIHEDDQRRIWLSMYGHGLHRVEEGGEITRMGADRGMPFLFIQSLGSDSAGRLWMTSTDGAHRLEDDGTLTTFTTADGLGHGLTFAIMSTRDGDLWLGTNGGLSRYRDGRFTNFTTADGLASDLVRALYEDRRGRLWIGTTGGLSLYENGTFASFTMADGLTSHNVFSIHEDEEGDLWLGTHGGGLNLLSAGKILAVTMFDGLPDDNLCSLFEDARGWLWIASSKGIFRVSRRQLKEYVAAREADRQASFATLLYSTADGLRNGVCFNHQARDIRGKYWFPTYEGIAVVDPEAMAAELSSPRARIERVVVDGEEREASANLRIPPEARTMEIHYTALGIPEPRRVRFRYRLDESAPWQFVGTRRVAYFTHLPPDAYRFQVEASREDGTWVAEPAELQLVVEPAIWETWSFYFFSGTALIALGWGLNRVRVQRLERYNLELRRMKGEVEAKNAELGAKNAELERFTYTVSHDLKSPLFTIQGFVGLLEKDLQRGDVKRAIEDFERIREAAGKMSHQLDDLLELSRIGRVLNPAEEVDLEALAEEAVSLLDGRVREIGAEVVVRSGLPRVMADRRRVLVVMQNLVENALRYRRLEVRPRVEISARRDGADVICTVADNGVGIEPADQQRIFQLFEQLDASGEGTGIGLALVERIVRFHGGRIWVESEGKGHGSAFHFALPAPG